MKEVAMIFLWFLLFPHEGRILSIDQLSFSHPDPSSGVSMVSMIGIQIGEMERNYSAIYLMVQE
jgi:hypothetical protein